MCTAISSEINIALLASSKEIKSAENLSKLKNISINDALVEILTKNAPKHDLEKYLLERHKHKAENIERAAKLSKMWKGWFDGAADPNPGRMGLGAILLSPNNERVEISQDAGYGTNNVAEYKALIVLLEKAIELNVSKILIKGDSQLVIKQVLGEWGVNAPNLFELNNKAINLVKKFDELELSWIERNGNKEADRLSKAALNPSIIPSSKKNGNKRDKNWCNPTEIGKSLKISAIAVNKYLVQMQLRKENKFPTDQAISSGLAIVVNKSVGYDIFWNKSKITIEITKLLIANKI